MVTKLGRKETENIINIREELQDQILVFLLFCSVLLLSKKFS